MKKSFNDDSKKSVSNPPDFSVSSTAKAKIILNGGSLKLNQEVLNYLKVKIGDRLCIRFNEGPVLATPEALGETNGGNLISKSLTVTCKGATQTQLLKYGTVFEYNLKSEGYLELSSSTDTEVIQHKTSKDTPIKEEIKSTIQDSVFTLHVKDGVEVEFDLQF